MSIRVYELFHGAVLSKLMHTPQQSIILRMFEVKPQDFWSVYTINDEVHLVIKYRTKGRASRSKNRISWTFTFSNSEIDTFRKLSKEKPVFVALVGGSSQISDLMEIGLLFPNEFANILGDNKQVVLTMRAEPRKKLRILYGRKVVYKIARNRLDSWQVPGT